VHILVLELIIKVRYHPGHSPIWIVNLENILGVFIILVHAADCLRAVAVDDAHDSAQHIPLEG